MKWFKKITAIVVFACTLITVNCFASTNITEISILKDNITYIHKTYEVNEKEADTFVNSLQKKFEVDKKQYVLEKINKSGGTTIETIDITTNKTITTNSNSTEDILSNLPKTIEYSENNYEGHYLLDINSLVIEINYNGYKEYLVDTYKEYFDLPKNDLSFIPKKVKKDGLTLDLLTTDWTIQSTRMLGENEIPNIYSAKCYYASKKRVDNPLTYTVNAKYFGTAEKVNENPFNYEVIYKCITKDKNYLPYILGGSGTVLIIVILLFKKKSKKDKVVQKV